MRRNTVNFLVECAAACAILGLAGAGIVLRYALPPGSGWRRSVWGMTRHEWGTAHFWLAVAMATAIVLHVAMHWTWIVSTITRRREPREER